MVNTWPGWNNVGLLGEGSFGKVYRIQREEFGQTYEAALKVITIPASQGDVRAAYAEGMDEESVTEYFRGFVEDIVAEFALMSKMKGNSNIVSYEDHMVVQHEGEVGWDILIRMELLTALPDYIVRHPLGELDVVRLGLDLAQALQLCRKRGILHRDIKPENIFVSKDGDFKLGDFGVARIAEKTISAMSRKGTYNYMAPEVYQGQEYGYTADIYSLGLVLYRFLNDNRTPFLPPYPQKIQYSDRERALNERMSGRQIPPPAHGSRTFQEVVLKCCAFRPQDRYGDAGQLEADLRRVLSFPSFAGRMAGGMQESGQETVKGQEASGQAEAVKGQEASRQTEPGKGWEASRQAKPGREWEASEQEYTYGGWEPPSQGRRWPEQEQAKQEETGEKREQVGSKVSGREQDSPVREESVWQESVQKEPVREESVRQEPVQEESVWEGSAWQESDQEEFLDKTLSAFAGRKPITGGEKQDTAREAFPEKERAGTTDGKADMGISRGTMGNLVQKPAGKQIFTMMLPFVLGGLCWQVYHVADMKMAAPYGSEMAAAASVGISLASLLGSFLVAVVTGGSTILTGRYHAQDGKGILDSVRTMLILAGIAGGVAALMGIFLTPVILQGMGSSPERMSYAIRYICILSLGFFPAAIYYGGVGILRTLGGGWRPFCLLAISAVLKVGFNFIYVRKNPVRLPLLGMALSTVTVLLAGAIAVSLAVHHELKKYRLAGIKGKFASSQTKTILLAGLPEGVMWALIGFFWALHNRGESYYLIDMSGFVALPIVGMSLAMAGYVRQNAKDLERRQLRRNVRTGCAMGAGIILALWVVIFLVNPIKTWSFLLLEYVLLAVAGCLFGVLRGAGLSRGPVAIGLVCWGVIRVGWMVVAPIYISYADVISRWDDMVWILGAVVLLLYAWKVDWPGRAQAEPRT